ncbi:isoprenyl transferase [Candidatus Aerophobetes bacterium]|nr:isoprenyl transferase [Candidatus Aerophobetes bacterium]
MQKVKILSEKLPQHLAIIMDGNGRWAKNKGLPRIEGHRVGMEKIRDVMNWCRQRGIKVLTLYAFSKQNWNRPREEVEFLMRIFEVYLEKEFDNLMEKGVMLRVIGRVEELPLSLRKKIKKIMQKTKANEELFLNLAINYGGQEEIVDAARCISALAREGKILPEDIDVELFRKYLYTPNLPYPDLIIRSGGELRISNFLLWQIAYAELWVSSVLWPDFTEQDLDEALKDFASRERRYGAIKGD